MLTPDNQTTIPLSTVKQIWKDLHADPELRKQLRPEIYDSWERSYHFGVPRYMKKIPFVLPEPELNKAREESKYLMETAIPVMERLSEFLKGSGFSVGLNDANSVSLKIIGDPETLELASHANVIEGTVWSEENVGTNATALSISLVKPISIYSYEHFSLYTIAASSSAAPIIDNGRVVGSICMSAGFERVTLHTLGMVVAAADHIQSIMALNRISKYHQVMTDAMSDGVMVVDVNSRITYMNNKCSAILGLTQEDISGATVQSLFGENESNSRFINIVTQGRAITDDNLLLHCGQNKISCQVSCTPLYNSHPSEMGSMVIIRESERINRMVGKWIGRSAKMSFDDIIGDNHRFQETVNIARTTCRSDSSVLLMGESGTGKDIIAQAMHNESHRRNHPFLAINCAALPRELIASELFGYDEGAFTGAKKGGNVGKFELANHGTLFLDEIGDVPVDLQVSLLRVLEEKGVLRLGGNKLIPVDVRIIAATNKNLEEEVAHNRFRRDLYYRLGVIRLIIPPLRERRDDIPLLVDHFLQIICNRFGRPLKRLTPLAMECMIDYEWPGNIREMQNILEGAVQLTPGIDIDFPFIDRYLRPTASQLTSNDYGAVGSNSSEEARSIQQALQRNRHNITKTALELGMSRQRLYRILHKHNLLS